MGRAATHAPEAGAYPSTFAAMLTSRARSEPAALIAAALSLLAGAIHLIAAPEHLDAWWGYGAFFLGAFVTQSVFAAALVRQPSQLLASIGIWGNVAIVWLYVLTRTSGVPFGPGHAAQGGHGHAGEGGKHVETVGALDMTATVAEVGIVFALVTLLGLNARRRTLNALLAFGAFMWLSWGTGLL
jgi:hypothetical protein